MNIEELKSVDKNDKYSGIYAIYNSLKNKIYIGSSIDIYDRVFGDHINELKKDKHYNKYLQRSYNKYSDYFYFVVLEKVSNVDFLIEREQYWMDYFDSYNSKFGYNLTPTAGSMLGFKHSEETKKYISEIQIGKKQSDETKRKRSESLKGEKCFWFGKKLTQEHIDKIQKSRGKYVPSDDVKRRISESKKGMKRTQEQIDKTREAKNKKVIQCTLDGVFIKEWESITIASSELEIHRGNISQCCKGKRNQVGGFKWKYKEEFEVGQ